MSNHRTLDAVARWTLDEGGTIYGDERERLRWYEGIAITTSIQWIVIAWTLAIMSLIADRSTAPYLAVLAAIFYLTMNIAAIYVARHRVALRVQFTTPKQRLITLIMMSALVITCVGLLRRIDGELSTGGLVAGFIGGAAGFAGCLVISRAQRRKLAATRDDA